MSWSSNGLNFQAAKKAEEAEADATKKAAVKKAAQEKVKAADEKVPGASYFRLCCVMRSVMGVSVCVSSSAASFTRFTVAQPLARANHA